MKVAEPGADALRRPRRNHTAAFKAKVAIAALKGDETLATLAKKFHVHANQITQWKTQLRENASGVFTTSAERQAAGPDLKDLHGKIGQQALEIDFLAGALGRIGDASAKKWSTRHTTCRWSGKSSYLMSPDPQCITGRSRLRKAIYG